MVRELPGRLQELLGYNIYPPFVGYVDGRHPRSVLVQTRIMSRRTYPLHGKIDVWRVGTLVASHIDRRIARWATDLAQGVLCQRRLNFDPLATAEN